MAGGAGSATAALYPAHRLRIHCRVAATAVLRQARTVDGTVGKLATGVRVVQADGTRPGIGPALVRSVVWIVDGLQFASRWSG